MSRNTPEVSGQNSSLAQWLADTMITAASKELDQWLTYERLRPALVRLIEDQLDLEAGDRALAALCDSEGRGPR